MIQELSTQRMTIVVEKFVLPFSLTTLVVSAFGSTGAFLLGAGVGPALGIACVGIASGGIFIGVALLSAVDEASNIVMDAATAEVQKVVQQNNLIANSNVQQLNINTGGVQKIGPTVHRHNGEIVALGNATVAKLEPKFIQFDDRDVFYLLQFMAERGHSRRLCVVQELPYSNQKVPLLLYETLVQALAAGGKIAGRRHGSAGELVDKDPRQLMKVVKSQFPDGVRLQLPEASKPV